MEKCWDKWTHQPEVQRVRLQTTEPGGVWLHPTVLNRRLRGSSGPGLECHCTGDPQVEKAGEPLAQVVRRPELPTTLGCVSMKQGARQRGSSFTQGAACARTSSERGQVTLLSGTQSF